MRSHAVFGSLGLICLASVLNAQVSIHIGAEGVVSTQGHVLTISGDWINQGRFLHAEPTELVFSGVTDQSIQQPPAQSISRIVINKANGYLLTTDTLFIGSQLALTMGHVKTDVHSPVILNSQAVITGGGPGSFVDGPLAKVYLSSEFLSEYTFSTGNQQDYRPVTVALAKVEEDSLIISVRQINQNASTLSSTLSGLDKISGVRYWHITSTATGPLNNANIYLSYDTTATDDQVYYPNELRVAQLDTGSTWIWKNMGGVGVGGRTGVIRSDPISFLLSGFFTLAEKYTYALREIRDLQYAENPEMNDESNYVGDTVTVHGLVMTNPRDLTVGPRWATFILDPQRFPNVWSGFFIIQHDTTVTETGFGEVKPGMMCGFTGVVEEFNHSTQVRLLTDPGHTVRVYSTDQPLPPPAKIPPSDLGSRQSGEKWESMWARFENMVVTDNAGADNRAQISTLKGDTTYMDDYFKWVNTHLNDDSYAWPDNHLLINVNGFLRDQTDRITLNPRDSIDLFLSNSPYFKKIADIPEDQGRYVRVNWQRNRFDIPGGEPTIVGYNLWEMVPAHLIQGLQISSKIMTENGTAAQCFSHSDTTWIHIDYVAAMQWQTYSALAETFVDSTASGNGLSYFFVSAHTTDPRVYYRSSIDSGYSVDNIVPTTPYYMVARQMGNHSVRLYWQENTFDGDFAYYAVHRSISDGFIPDDNTLLATTVDSFYIDANPLDRQSSFYKVMTYDANGNPSPPIQSAIYFDSSLPVDLTKFELSSTRGIVRLEWATASELQNQFWWVQRWQQPDTLSKPGDEFETIAQIDGQGSTGFETEYAYMDNNVEEGHRYYYRLVDVGQDGGFYYHEAKMIDVGLPDQYKLYQNYPNPFNPVTHIPYDLPVRSEVQIAIYNMLGQMVTELVNQEQEAGYYTIPWNAADHSGEKLSSGVYFLTIRAVNHQSSKPDDFSKVIKVMLLK